MNWDEAFDKLIEDQEFLECLPIVRKEKWKKASVKEKLGFFNVIQRVIHSLNDYFPSNVIMEDLEKEGIEENVLLDEESVIIKKSLFYKKFNPYHTITNYLFELALCYRIDATSSIKKCKNEEERKMMINMANSKFGDWDNFFERGSEEFHFQPIVRFAADESTKMVMKLLSYVHDCYGMDDSLGEFLSRLMIRSFSALECDIRINDNFLEMEKKYCLLKDENKKIEKVFTFLKNNKIKDLDDDTFFSLLNTKLIQCYSPKFCEKLYREFTRRLLKDYKNVNEVIKSIKIHDIGEYTNCLLLNDKIIFTDASRQLDFVFGYITKIKINNKLLDDVEDEKLKQRGLEVYDYIEEVKDENGIYECEYYDEAYSSVELISEIRKIYYEKISKAIQKSEIFNEGESLIEKTQVSKKEAFLKYTYNMSYEEVKRAQFEKLKRQYLEKKGGRK